MSLLAIDIGNTALKVGCFVEKQAGGRAATVAGSRECLWMAELATGTNDFAPLTAKLDPVAHWFVSSVHRPTERMLAEWVGRNRAADSYRLLNFRDVPLQIDVDFPERVGFDRLATAVAAFRLRSGIGPVIVVDVGTALKVHAVSAAGEFLGGTISPGLKLSARALAQETDLLPLVSVTTNTKGPPVLGKNTEAAIRGGLYWGVIGAVRETISRMRDELSADPEIFVTGGDARGVAGELGARAKYQADLCLTGIAAIAQEL